jgi:threonine dehydratase
MTDQEFPTLHDIIAARPHVYRYLKPTPLYRYFGLSDLIGANVWVKHENHLPGGAYKVRGGLNLVAHLSQQERESGLFTASTGNHGQSIAFAARAHGLRATIAVPEGANPGKVAAMQQSWVAGRPVTAAAHTVADGLALSVPFENTRRILRKYLDDFVLVDDRAIEAAVVLLLEHTHNLAEGAGAAPLAAALKLRDRLAGKNVVLVMTGGNLSIDSLRKLLAHSETAAAASG